MLKILHIADLHLDSPMHRLSLNKAKEFKNRLRDTFDSALDFASKQGCGAVLISGDLFDAEFYSKSTLTHLINGFKSNPQIKFFISPGNHDPLTPGSPYLESEFPENVHIFKSEELESVSIPELDLTVCGYAFTSHSHTERPISGFTSKGNGYNVLCAHTELDAALSPYAPISRAELERSGFDYAALGHIHTKPEIEQVGKTTFAYSGCIAGRDFSEQGEKGGILVTLGHTLGKTTVNAERIRFCPWSYDELTLDISGKTEEELDGFIKSETERYIGTHSETEHILRITLTGVTGFSPDCKALSRSLADLGVTSVESEITLLPPDGLELDYTVKGEFFRLLKPMLESEDPKVRKKALLALRYGLDALEGNL